MVDRTKDLNRGALQAQLNAEMQARLKWSDKQVREEVERIFAILQSEKAGDLAYQKVYCEAWIDAGYLIVMHGATLIDALKKTEKS